jgi:hypothetical protein
LGKLQSAATNNLIDSAARTRVITGQFRKLQKIKDLFQQMQAAVIGIGEARSTHELAVLRGQTVFALNGMIESADWSKALTDALRRFQMSILDSEGPFALRTEILSDGGGEMTQHILDAANVRSVNELRQLKRILDEHSDDSTMALDLKTVSLEED